MEQTKAAPVWLWAYLWSVDAPLVALVWQDFAARCYPSALLPAGRWMLGLSVWSIYLLDRLLDSRLAPGPSASALHSFYRRHFRAFAALFLGALIADFAVAALSLRPAVRAGGWPVAGAVVLYLGLFAIGRVGGVLKTVGASLLFTTGVLLVAFIGLPQPVSELWGPALAFGALCFINLTLIRHGKSGRPLRRCGLQALSVAAVCLAMGARPWFAAVGCSALLTGALAFSGDRCSADARRVLADVVLLSPLLFWYASR